MERKRERAIAAARERRRIARRKAAGLCLACGKRPPAPHKAKCEPCLEKRRQQRRKREAGKPYAASMRKRAWSRERAARQRAERALLGLCQKCGNRPAAPGANNCDPCRQRQREIDRRNYARHVERGQCTKCPRAARPGKSTCERHAPDQRTAEAKARKNDSARARYWERKRAGLCTDCGEPAPGGAARCDPCAARSWGAAQHRMARDGFAVAHEWDIYREIFDNPH